MKKTLIALAVAASAVVSGSAMAWDHGGTGGNMKFGGTLIPTAAGNPWEVKVGSDASGLDAVIAEGGSLAKIAVKQPILVLGIRTATNKAFMGRSGFTPQINFGDAVDVDGFDNGVTTLTLDVKNGADKIGKLTVPFNVGAVISFKNEPKMGDKYGYLSAHSENGGVRGFAGGLSASWDGVNKEPLPLLNSLSAELMANFDSQGMSFNGNGYSHSFASDEASFSAAYGAGILDGDFITITLNDDVQFDNAIRWSASLPVTVSYV
ncbi:hypothetical protein UJ53_004221 [Salmonella enterica subsp. enterica]|nr:hypothetical protein [Salmonella enterica]EBN0563313.1 hypothetical protein [Salmonella enterica subsp. enterica serovar Corvallis]EBV4333443.1 hypothetical protein [Salmonella enterica subsp. enterica serovar Caracas]ECE0047564.1 hypothetical protein [Salmonella enterica subsp. enterica]ECE0798178.1 hypothetical protein [Salmonella enterica subsp. enterica serovar Onderstepoort]ECI0234619.1 hypothetical protein [Salmonella enterica subsp. enterica serovar Bahrenfeld]ECT8341601.1 hypotheti